MGVMATRYSWFLTSLGTPTFTVHSLSWALGQGPSGSYRPRRPSRLRGGHGFDAAQRAQHVAARQLREIVVGPVRLAQGLEQAGVRRHVVETLGQPVAPVVVTTQPDVVHSRDLAHVVEVGDDVGQRGRR